MNGRWPWAPDDPPGAIDPAALEAHWAALGGGDWPSFQALVTPLLALTASAARWWLTGPEPDPDDPLTRWTLDQPALRDALLLAAAGDRRAPERQLELQQVPAAALDTLDAALLALTEQARAGVAAAGTPAATMATTMAAIDAFLAEVAACWRSIRTVALFRRMAAGALASRWSPDVLAGDAGAAAAYLLDEPTFRRAWEVQRWGVAGHPGPLIGNQYIRGLILGCLHEAGFDQSEPLRALLAELPGDGPPRYYGDWRGIPPDADSLGLFLDLDARLRALEPAQVARWLDALGASLQGDGLVRTWLYLSPDGPATSDPEQRWVGDDCPAVRLVALTGLTAWGADLGELIARNTADVLERLGAGDDTSNDTADTYYSDRYTDLLLARYARACERADAPHADAVRAALGGRRARLREQQHLDGGWGSPQETAFALETLALATGPLIDGDAMALRRGLRYLSERQYPDGSWAMDDLFIMPAKPPAPQVHYRSAEITTALCLRALCAARDRLAAHERR